MDTNVKTKKKRGLKSIFALCPRRHIVLLSALAVIGLYYILRVNSAVMNFLCDNLVYPYHRTAARIFGILPFSVMELIYTIIGIFSMIMIVRCGILIMRTDSRYKHLYRTVISLVCVGTTFFAAYCLLWSTTYYADSFSQKSGIEALPVSAQELEAVTAFFIDVANEYAPQVKRDSNGIFHEDENKLFDQAVSLYDSAIAEFPHLEGASVRPKKMVYSLLMSNMNFTGVFFPITGEANLNVHSPQSFLPATLAHEIAHQRGVAAEDEANFVAVMACLKSEDPAFVYSAALLAYIHLGNALHSADYEAWENLYYQIDDAVQMDLRENNEYWAGFETKTAEISERVYSGFLLNNGQELGIKSYGACVDLLVAYYYDSVK